MAPVFSLSTRKMSIVYQLLREQVDAGSIQSSRSIFTESGLLRASLISFDLWAYSYAQPRSLCAIEPSKTPGLTSPVLIFTPGHSPASLSFYCEEDQFVIAGDVLFQGSIGRTDLPGGDFNTLIQSIRTRLFTLPDEVVVYPGHGPSTSIGYEKKYNPFLQD